MTDQDERFVVEFVNPRAVRPENESESAGGERTVRSLAAFATDDVLVTFEASRSTNSAANTLQISESEHSELSPAFLSLLNHSCAPNAAFDVEQKALVALRPIAIGDFIEIFYPATEWDMAVPFVCGCGQVACLGQIQGALHLSPEVVSKYKLAPHIVRSIKTPAAPWWLQTPLSAGPNGLKLDNVPLADVARRIGTPLYVYSAMTIRRQLAIVRDTLRSINVPFRIHYAMKACRFGPVLEVIRNEADIGIDVCSPNEMVAALAAGFKPDEISVTAGNLSNRDLVQFAQHGVHLNLDSRSTLRRWAATPGHSTKVGLRVDPAVSVGWGETGKMSYGNSKFGFDANTLLETVAYAQSLGLEVDELHVHVGWGLQAHVAPLLGQVFERLAGLARDIVTVRTINVGGGLCARQRVEDNPLSPSAWAELIRSHLADTGCSIACELGTFVVASAGVLVAEVNTVESRQHGTWIGIDAGHNVNCYAAHYGIPLAIMSVERPLSPSNERVHVAGNINEANDVFARSVQLQHFDEGDLVAFHPAGAYGASMASNHCMRGLPLEVLI